MRIRGELEELVLKAWKRGYAWTGNSEADFKTFQAELINTFLAAIKEEIGKAIPKELGVRTFSDRELKYTDGYSQCIADFETNLEAYVF